MAASTGIVLGATGIVVANEWIQTDKLNWKAGAAGLVLTLFMAGAEKISQPLAVGLSSIMLVTVLITPVAEAKDSPLITVSHLFGSGSIKRG